MSSSRIAVVCVLLALSGCGFRPLYAPPAEDTARQKVYAFDVFRKVAIDNLPDRSGQFLRNRLIQLLHPDGRDSVPAYGLSIGLREAKADLAVKKSAVATRANLTVTANISLRDIETGKSVFSGSVLTTSGYNIYQSEFQTLTAAEGARERALKDVAEQIRTRLAVYLASQPAGVGHSVQ